jgi:hypothetical protein
MPSVTSIIQTATPSVDWTKVLKFARECDIVDIANAMRLQRETILASSDDNLRVIMDVLQSVRGYSEILRFGWLTVVYS